MLALAILAPALCSAGDDKKTLLTRDEVGVFKKKLVTVLDALGLPPAGFVKQKDDFSLPTEWYKEKGSLVSNHAYANRKFAIKGVKDAEAATKQASVDYQKKLLEAQAKGDYQEMMRVTQEMQKGNSQTTLKAVQAQEEKKLPIEVKVELNQSEYKAIDPDLVVFEKEGVLALKTQQGDEGDPKETVTVYFQPVTLKETKTLSQVEIKAGAVPGKTSVSSITVELEGPAADVEAWAKRIDTKKVLELIDATVK
jgi:hypothetical protein